MYEHIPVLLNEALEYLNPKPGQNFIDGTLGGGGYTERILEAVAPTGKVLSIDLDLKAIEHLKARLVGKSYAKNSLAVHGNFARLDDIVMREQFSDIAGIVFDIGLSSFQLDQSSRGISFQKDELLDMRFDQSDETSDARFIVNNYTEAELTKLFRDYSEERNASRIARAIITMRAKQTIQRTGELVEAIKSALPKPVAHKWTDNARRIFQALRIEVNHELQNLQEFLPKALDLVIPGGVLVVVSFHSLEDRVVKQFMNEAATGCICPPDFPICQCGQTPIAKILTKKLVSASEMELTQNSRSKAAKLRALQKL